MECPNCGAELVYEDYYYRGILYTSSHEKLGDIFKCPNFEGFETNEDAQAYLELTGLEVGKDFGSIEEVGCSSFEFSGNFYTDLSEDLHEGYPC